MWKHIICFKFKEKADAKTAKEMLESLQGKIPGLISVECGLNEYDSNRSYDLFFCSVFESKEAYHAYDIHPEHQKVREYIHSVRESSVAVDFTV